MNPRASSAEPGKVAVALLSCLASRNQGICRTCLPFSPGTRDVWPFVISACAEAFPHSCLLNGTTGSVSTARYWHAKHQHHESLLLLGPCTSFFLPCKVLSLASLARLLNSYCVFSNQRTQIYGSSSGIKIQARTWGKENSFHLKHAAE